MAMVAMWALVGVAFSSAQWGDHFEQFIWAHSVQWGYHKHPPLPTWLLAAAIELFGPSVESARTLAVVCVLGTGLFTYLVARELFDRPTAALSLLFWGLQHPFSQRCYLFNHNTVLMLTISAVVWCVIRALRAPASVRWWLAVGALAGLSLLSKYQAIVPLVGVLLAVWLSGELCSTAVRRGMVLAAAVAIAVITPHIGWVVQHHLSTLEYATQQGHSLSWFDRGLNVVSFIAQQLRYLLPALVLGILVLYISRRENAGIRVEPAPLARRERAWLLGLIAFPFLATLLTGPLLGLRLQNHWGYQALQFAGLFFAWRLRNYLGTTKLTWLVLALAVHSASLVLALQLARSGPSSTIRMRIFRLPGMSVFPFGSPPSGCRCRFRPCTALPLPATVRAYRQPRYPPRHAVRPRRNEALLSIRLSTAPQIMLASSSVTSVLCWGVSDSASSPRKSAAMALAAGRARRISKQPGGSPSKLK